MYGFRRLTIGKDKGGKSCNLCSILFVWLLFLNTMLYCVITAYYHALFLRERPDLAKLVFRIRIKGNGTKAAASPETEPNCKCSPAVALT